MKALTKQLIRPIVDGLIDSGLLSLGRLNAVTNFYWGRRLLANALVQRHHALYSGRSSNNGYWESEDSLWWHLATKMDSVKVEPLKKILDFIAKNKVYPGTIKVADVGSGLMRLETLFSRYLSIGQYDKYDINPHVVKLQKRYCANGSKSARLNLATEYAQLRGYDLVVFVYGVLMYFPPTLTREILERILKQNGSVLISGEGRNSADGQLNGTLGPNEREGDPTWMHDFRHMLKNYPALYGDEKNLLVSSKKA